MQKIQILFPDPLMAQMRKLAETLDMPVSEVVRRATEEWLNKLSFLQSSGGDSSRMDIPTFDGGPCLLAADQMRDLCSERGFRDDRE